MPLKNVLLCAAACATAAAARTDPGIAGSASLKRSHRVSTLRPILLVKRCFECECRCAQHF
eukprot:m.112237 g.112237  ORF g.112237 m.112237 type:complete len:61 (-) comp12963_c0_seq5:1613-1795(-)